MLSNEVRRRVDRLLTAATGRADQFPVAALVELHRAGVDVDVRFGDRGQPTVAYVSAAPDGRLAGLTDREREVAELTASGRSNAQIAAALFISVATVKDHLHSIFTKTGFDHRGQLIAAWYGGLDGDHTPLPQRGEPIDTTGSPSSRGPASAR